MEVTTGAEEGFVREWTPCSHILNLIPPRIQTGIFSNELSLTCVDAVSEYIALGTNVGLVYWYDRKKGNIQKLRCEATTSPITYVKIVSTVDYMVGAGNAAGQVTVFQIPKEHPENVPDTFKPKVEPKVERYTIGDLHKSKITAIEWSKNGMRLFSGDKNGVIIMTEIDFYMHLCKSAEVVDERHAIVQLSYCQGALLVSSVYRTIVCERRDARWHVRQLGKKERRSLCALGATFQYSYARGGGGAAAAYCARPGLRLWRADRSGEVLQTLLFKEAISNPLTVAELLNPAARGAGAGARGAGGAAGEGGAAERSLGPLHVFREHFLVSHDERALYILDPRSLTAVAVVDDLRRILSVSVNKEEIFVLEGPHSLVRLAHAPEPAALATEEPVNLMSRSLSSSLQQAVSSVRALALLDPADDTGVVVQAEECFEQPARAAAGPGAAPGPAGEAAGAKARGVLHSIAGELTNQRSDAEWEELQKKLKVYDSIMGQRQEDELIHRSRRAPRRASPAPPSPRRPPAASPAPPPAAAAPPPAPLRPYQYESICQESDDLLEKQIEEKEKILAKMLNLESLSMTSAAPDHGYVGDTCDTAAVITRGTTVDHEHIGRTYDTGEVTTTRENGSDHEYIGTAHVTTDVITTRTNTDTIDKTDSKDAVLPQQNVTSEIRIISKEPPERPSIVDLVPKVVKLPNNWNLENFELRLDLKSALKGGIVSPDDNLDGDWEVI